MRLIISCLLLFLGIKPILAQDAIAQKIEWLGKAKPTTNLFVHFDKNVYSNNETVYFTGYLLKFDSIATKEHRVMAVALIREVDSTVVLQDKFYMNNGLAFGNLTILNKILAGNYYFIAYTDITINNIPTVIFSQLITIKTALDPPFKASMRLLNDQKKDSTSKNILINVSSEDGRFLTNPVQLTYKYGSKTTVTKADKSGQLLISLPPIVNLIDPNIYVKVKYGRDSNFISMAIPQPKSKASVSFYPEGGNMVTGIPSIVAWEVKDQQRLPLLTKAILYKNDEIINNLETNGYGMGKFRLMPEENAIYKIKLVHSSLVDSTYYLPKAQKAGIVLNVSEAVTSDTLSVLFRNNLLGKVTIRLHNFQKSYVTIPFNVKKNIQILKIPLVDVPKGLTTLTITDSLERPLAERMFFAHYEQKNPLDIRTDKPIYNQREKVKVTIALTDTNTSAVVSTAAVQNSRLSLKNKQDIVNFNYLTSELNQLPQHLNADPINDKSYMEQILLVKGWSRYTWQDVEFASEKLAIVKTDTLKFSGQLTYKKKDVKIENVITYGSPTPLLIPLDTLGNFFLDSDHMVEKTGTRLFFLLNTLDRLRVNYNYQIKLNDPYIAMSAKLAKKFNPEGPIMLSSLRDNAELILKNSERIIQLKEVVIGNECGDYVCPYNILNCVNHVGFKENTIAKIGYTYIAYSGKPETITYKGCDEPNENVFFKARPVFLQKEFYISDYKDPLEPAFFSTIYWNYGLILNGNKEAELEFYTSDITGKFRIVVQGITNKDVIYGEHFFEVKPKVNP